MHLERARAPRPRGHDLAGVRDRPREFSTTLDGALWTIGTRPCRTTGP
jgi:hypothetical protein